MACKEKDLGPMLSKAQKAMSEGRSSEHTMLLRRLRVYLFSCRLQVFSQGFIKECPACFARLVLQSARRNM